MTEDEMKLLHKFANGPIDAYDIHYVRPVVSTLLEEYARLRALQDALCERVATQSELLSKRAEKTLIIADDPNKPSPFWNDEQVRAWWEEMFRDSPAPLPTRDATVPGTDHASPPAAQAPQDPQDSNGGEEPQVP